MKKNSSLILFLVLSLISFGQSVKTETSSPIRYHNITEASILSGIGLVHSNLSFGSSNHNDAFDISLTTINGILINSIVYTGIGIGYENEKSDGFSVTHRVPLFLDIRFFLLQKSLSPFIFTEMGYALAWSRDGKGSDWGGLLMNLGVGLQYKLSGATSLLFSAGYKIQQTKLEWYRVEYYYNYTGVFEHENSIQQFITIKIGFAF